MRIAVITTSYPMHPEDPSGHFVRADAQRLARLGHEVHVICPGAPGLLIPQDFGISLWPIPTGEAFGWPGFAARLRSNPLRLPWFAAFVVSAQYRLARLAPDRILAHWLVPGGYPIACRLARRGQLELVAHGADVRLLLALPSAIRNRIVGTILFKADRIRFAARTIFDRLLQAVDSDLAARLLQCACVEAPPLDIPDVSVRARSLREGINSERLATVVGRLVPGKRVDLAIEAVANLKGLVHLCVIGDGPESARLASLVPSSVVSFPGRLPRGEALAWIRASDVLIHPSKEEAAPCVVREARLLDTPVVACDCGDLSEWAKSDAGIQIVAPEVIHITEALRLSLGIVC